MSHLPPLYSPSAYAQVPTVPAVPVVAPTAPPNPAHNDAHVAASPADYGQPLGGAGVDLGAAFPPTPYTPYAYHGQHADSPHHHPLPLVSPAAPTTHHPQYLAPIEHPRIPVPIPMPEPQRPSRAPPLPHRRQESLLQLVPHASVRSPPMTATTQLFMPSPPSANNNNLVSSSHLFEEPVASSQGSASYLVERVPVDDSVNVDSFEQRRVLVPTGRSPPTSSAIIPIASSAASSTSAAAAGSLTRPPATAAVVPSAPTSSSLARPTLPDWAKDPDDDRPPIRPPVFLTLPFIITLLLLLISLAGIVTIRIILPAYVAALADDASPTFLLAYQWLLVASVAYSLAYLALFSSCFYNRHARKVSVSPQRQAWKLSVRRWLLLPIEVGLTVAWLILTLIIGLVKDESALYLTVCTMNDPTGSGLVSARVGVSCTQATTMLVLAGMMASACGISMGQLAWATWKNQQKVNEFKVVEGGEQLGV